jgi:IS5 family transposase
MEKVYGMTERHELFKENVPVEEKIFSIYERHTDIIVKGKREVPFGHKVRLSGGKSSLILTCEIEKGNPKDSELYEGTIEEIKEAYGKRPESGVADGGYASGANIEYAKGEGIINIVFNKIVGNIVKPLNGYWPITYTITVPGTGAGISGLQTNM